MLASVTEAGLVDSARAGEQWAMRELYRRHAAHVLAVARSRLGADVLAEDAAQDAWLQAFKALPRFRGEAAFGTWLHRIALNAASSACRQRSRWQAVHSPLPDRVLVAAPPRAASLPEELRRAIRALPDGMRQVLALHVQGYTHREIGQRLRISEGTSKSQLSRARRQLREELSSRADAHPLPTGDPIPSAASA